MDTKSLSLIIKYPQNFIGYLKRHSYTSSVNNLIFDLKNKVIRIISYNSRRTIVLFDTIDFEEVFDTDIDYKEFPEEFTMSFKSIGDFIKKLTTLKAPVKLKLKAASVPDSENLSIMEFGFDDGNLELSRIARPTYKNSIQQLNSIKEYGNKIVEKLTIEFTKSNEIAFQERKFLKKFTDEIMDDWRRYYKFLYNQSKSYVDPPIMPNEVIEKIMDIDKALFSFGINKKDLVTIMKGTKLSNSEYLSINLLKMEGIEVIEVKNETISYIISNYVELYSQFEPDSINLSTSSLHLIPLENYDAYITTISTILRSRDSNLQISMANYLIEREENIN